MPKYRDTARDAINHQVRPDTNKSNMNIGPPSIREDDGARELNNYNRLLPPVSHEQQNIYRTHGTTESIGYHKSTKYIATRSSTRQQGKRWNTET